jgi:hypothetical protein
MSFFPHPRRVVTGHDDNGKAIFVDDKQIPCEPVPANCNFAVLYETHGFPVSNDGWQDPIANRTESLSNKDGIVLRCVDFKPNTKTVLRMDLAIASSTAADVPLCSCFIAPSLSISASSIKAK